MTGLSLSRHGSETNVPREGYSPNDVDFYHRAKERALYARRQSPKLGIVTNPANLLTDFTSSSEEKVALSRSGEWTR